MIYFFFSENLDNSKELLIFMEFVGWVKSRELEGRPNSSGFERVTAFRYNKLDSKIVAKIELELSG